MTDTDVQPEAAQHREDDVDVDATEPLPASADTALSTDDEAQRDDLTVQPANS